MKLILASGSPRRKDLLNQIGVDFEIMVSNLEENASLDNGIEEYVKSLAMQKASDIENKTNGDRIILGADTVVLFNEKVLEKPRDREEAFDMLKQLQSNKCMVLTGIAVICIKNNERKIYNEVSTCNIFMDEMTDEEIYEYIDTNEPMDKAGAFAIQGIGARYIKKVEGDYYATVGLPINRLYEILKEI